LGPYYRRYVVHVNLLSAAAILISAPVVLLYLIPQRRVVRGVRSGAVKE
jgi:raffinose/stachyose/melibiose transport system permease protein